MTLVVGLGNIGAKYSQTRHNIGFEVIDSLISKFSTKEISNSSFRGELFRDGNLFFLKPSTFMNLSGESVNAVKHFFKIENLIIIHDELDLPFGAIRFKVGGGTGGHNGLKSLDNFSKENALRIRMGIGKPELHNISNYVLSKFDEVEIRCFDIWVESATDSIVKILKSGSWQKVASQNSKKSIKDICPDGRK